MTTSGQLAMLQDKCCQARARVRRVVDELSDDQLAWRPKPLAHSIGFVLWHVARCDDNVQIDLTGGPLELIRGGYAARWGHPERGAGTGWDDEKAAALPLPPKGELLEYVTRVFKLVDDATNSVDDERFAMKLESRFMSGESTYGEVLLVCFLHDNRHLGEMEYIKGLQGLRGTATT
jgi:hypothetical protein